MTLPTASGGDEGKSAAQGEVDRTAEPGISRVRVGLSGVESSIVADGEAEAPAFRAGLAGTGTGTLGAVGVAAA